MLSMQEKVLLGLVIVCAAAVAAHFIVPVSTYEVKLVTSPEGRNLFIPAGKSFNITCQGLGDDERKFTSMIWINTEGKAILQGIPGVIKGEKNSLVLTFVNPKVEETGLYKCTAVYDKTEKIESGVVITFYANKPSFLSTYENTTAEEGSYLKVPCSAMGDEPITYSWFDQYENHISNEKNPHMYVLNSVNESALVIPKVEFSNEGTYTCRAGNQHGLTSKIYELTVIPSSGNENNGTDFIRNAEAVNITSNSVIFDLDVSGPVRLIEVIFSESRDATQMIMDWNYGEEYKVKNLIPGGLYSFKFRTVPSKDDAWSKPYQVVLLPDVPEVIFRNLEGGSAKIEWFRPVDDIMRGTVDKFELTYYTVRIEGGSRWVPSTCAITVQIPKCAGSSYTITGLSQRSYYEIQLRAHTASGYGQPFKQKIYIA